MRNKKVLLLSTTVALAASISACGIFGGNDTPTPSSSNTTPTSSSVSSSVQSSSASQASSSTASSSEASSSSSTDSSESSSSSSDASSSSATQVKWVGNYLMAEGSASQASLTVKNADDKKFDFEFYIKGIDYSGTATVDPNSPHIATYQDPSHTDYSLTFNYTERGIVVAEKGNFPDAECSFEGNYAMQ